MTRFASRFRAEARRRMADGHERAAVSKATATYAAKVEETKAAFLDWPSGRGLLRSRKWEAIEHLDRFLEQFERHAEARGTRVHWAADAAEARAIILEICRRHEVRRVVKSKSMVTEEIHLNAALERHGIQAVETDLGEYIAQLRGEPPYHIVTPVMHLTKEDIDGVFHKTLGTPLGATAEGLAGTARRVLREAYLTADLGVTGANFLVADTGMISITENEGNGRLTSALPRVHVAVAGIEKVIPRLEDLALFLPMLAVSGTGQPLTGYNTLLGGPRQPSEPDGPEEMHVVLLDNGRTRLLAEAETREALHCIRCGACLNACPIFKSVGGFSYGTTYQGPIGSVITPHFRGLHEWKHLSYASSLCGACSDVCPVHIDLHHHLLRNRRDAVAAGSASAFEWIAFRVWAGIMRSPAAYRFSARAGRVAQRFSRMLGIEGSLLDPARAWTARRAAPTLAPESFRDWWKRTRGGRP
ncbi:MAG: iron-sulfur cluster-binding protein [Verrucomicrobiae bacterium]|nr:iron-sulfur cluster-binding protein [Verrucomicrobiae bacterium]